MRSSSQGWPRTTSCSGSATDSDIYRLVALPEQRALTAAERELLDFLLAGPVESPELRAQARAVVVDRVCECGCPSIGLAVDTAAPRVPFDRAESRATGLVGVLKVEATLHVVCGVMEEVEVWPALATTDVWPPDVPATLPQIETLRFVDS